MLKLYNQNDEEPVSSKTPHQSRVSYNLHIDRSHLSHSQIVLCIILSRMASIYNTLKSVNASKMYKQISDSDLKLRKICLKSSKDDLTKTVPNIMVVAGET